MRTMTWDEIDKDWAGLRKRHRIEIAKAVARYCIGHKLDEVAKRLDFSPDWLRQQLNYAGLSAAVGEGSKLSTPPGKAGDAGVDHAVSRIVRDFAPDVKVNLQGHAGDQRIAGIEGDDAEQFEPYLDHYLEQGHEPAAATRLAKAEWAGEAAVDADVIKEDVNTRNEKVNRILFPKDNKDTFGLDLNMHMARVKSAAKFLREANVRNLRLESTCEKVAAADELWREEAESVLAHYQPSA